jgi:hypothetical protein
MSHISSENGPASQSSGEIALPQHFKALYKHSKTYHSIISFFLAELKLEMKEKAMCSDEEVGACWKALIDEYLGQCILVPDFRG